MFMGALKLRPELGVVVVVIVGRGVLDPFPLPGPAREHHLRALCCICYLTSSRIEAQTGRRLDG